MRVLLISPVANLDPAGGDVTYTQTLISHPPDGVKYVTYADALADGTLVEHGVRRSVRAARESPVALARELTLAAVKKGVGRLRRRGWLFQEPVRFFSVKPGAYDLIHLHVFSARFRRLDCALVVSSGTPQRDVYRDGRSYAPARVHLMEVVEVAMGRAVGANLNSHRLPQASRLMVYSDYLKAYCIERRVVPADMIDIVPLYLPLQPAVIASRPLPRRVGFVAREFDIKGGQTLLHAFERVRAVRPDADLTIVGSRPQLSEPEMAARGIRWIDYVPRAQLLEQILPSFDVFAYPTNFDCISNVLLEAMSAGIAVATSDYPSMPEVVDHGTAGLISPVRDVVGLSNNILRLLEPATNHDYRLAARARFESHYSAAAVTPLMLRSYLAALEGHRPLDIEPVV